LREVTIQPPSEDAFKKSGPALIQLLIYCASALLQIYHAAIIEAKRSFHAFSVSSNITNPRKLWTTVDKILHRKISKSMPTCSESTFLSSLLLIIFSSKIIKIHANLLSDMSRTSHIPCPLTPPKFDFFMPASVDEISKTCR
jgi:hypothetical protein